MVLGRRWALKNHFNGVPQKTDFQLVEEELGELADRQFIFTSSFISVDPYQRLFSFQLTPPATMIGTSVAKVTSSKHPDYPVGCQVLMDAGWVEVGVCSPDDPNTKPPKVVPDMSPLSSSLHLGACGMPGMTAYFGLLDICDPKPSDTVVVSGAAGAVGSLVGQIAKLKGCKVIGFAGSEEKCAWLRKLGYDFAFNYKTVSVSESLAESAPEGVDCYFDNVGGDMAVSVISAMNNKGRVAVCGAISHYNEVGEQKKVTDILPICIFKELKVQGFQGWSYVARWSEGISEMSGWISKGDVKAEETIIKGFENTPGAFIGLFTGRNIGKMIVKL